MPRKRTRVTADPFLVPIALIERKIYVIRGQKVMLSPDLAELYHVENRALIQATKRNQDRFPEDFMFQLTPEEFRNLKSQIVISSWGGVRAAPYAFTELGVAMLSSVLRSARAVQMNILVMRTFVRLRERLAIDKDLARRMERLDAVQERHTSVLTVVVEEIRQLKRAPSPPKRKIGYMTGQT